MRMHLEAVAPARSAPSEAASVRRSCFVCGSSAGEVHLDETWEILALGEVRKGFRICEGCGLVLQDPAVPPATMETFYASFSNYTNPMADGQPSPVKVRAVECQLEFLAERVGKGNRVFQVGSSDGYTLSRFKERGCAVLGCDPSANAAAVASRLWDVETRVTPFERYAFEADETYDWIVLTHVLEHLYDPVDALVRCREALEESVGRLFIEVPLLAAPERFPPGYFQFEHINYFSEASLRNTLHAAGFEVEGAIEVDLESDQYPIQRLVARCTGRGPVDLSSGGFQSRVDARSIIRDARSIVREFARSELRTWRAFEEKIVASVGEGREAYLWGAGIHTSILLGRTAVRERVRIRGIIDSDPQKWGLMFSGLTVSSPEALLEEPDEPAIILSTLAGESAIARYLREHDVTEARIVRLYGDARDDE